MRYTDHGSLHAGTPEYIAPEIIAHKGHSAAADWWSLGILIYELLTGLTPYETEEGGMATYKKIMDGRFQLYSETEQAQGLIRGLLTQDPTKRLGCQASGLQEIVGHKWWQASDFDWTALETRQSVSTPFPFSFKLRIRRQSAKRTRAYRLAVWGGSGGTMDATINT
eukprot:COSAG01_NODE_1860_length_9040_cov_20.109607_4_plen_167_part_00